MSIGYSLFLEWQTKYTIRKQGNDLRMTTYVIVNKKAQFVKKNSYVTENYLKQIFARHNFPAKIFFIAPPELPQVVDQILDKLQEKDMVIVGGGDGTVSTVVDLVSDKKITIGVLPLGTLNHFAKDLNMPIDIEQCIEIFKSGVRKTIDIGEINNRNFVNNATIGFYPKMVRERNKQMRWYKLGKFSALFLSAVNIFHRFPLYHVTLSTDNHVIDMQTPLVFIGNNEYELMLFRFGSRENLQAEKLCVYLANSVNRLQFLKLLFLMGLGLLNQSRDFVKLLTTEVSLDSKQSTIQVAVDGEIITLKNPLYCKIHPKKLTVCVPR